MREKNIKKWEKKLIKKYPKAIVSNTFSNKLFKDFREEKKSLTIAMFVIILIAFIAIFITLNVVLADKMKDFSLLKVLGINNQQLSRVFFGQGTFIAFVGVLMGFFLGSLIIVNLNSIILFVEDIINNIRTYTNLFGLTNYPPYTKFKIMPEEVFYLSSLPYKLEWKDFIVQGIGAFLFAIIASLSPAIKVIKTDPATLLRNE